MNFRLVLFFSFFCTTTIFAAEKPVVLWASNPVKPGETVMLYGGNWNKTARIKLSGAASEPLIEPSVVTDTNITFVYPKNHPSQTLQGVVVCDALESEPFRVNSPVVWWMQGDWGKEASPGGWIRIFGTAIAMDPDRTKIGLRKADKTILLPATKADRWNFEAAIPEDFEPGTYEVFLIDSMASQTVASITIKPHEDVWKTEVFNVVDFGAIPNDRKDDTQAVLAALEKLTENGGGILYFPRGRFQIEGELTIPPHTLIKGQSRELTQLYWLDRYDPPPALIRGTHSFGLEDLTIFTANHLDGIVSNTLFDEENGNITLRRIRIRLLFTQYLYLNTEEMARRSIPLHHKRLVRLGGEFIRITDCDLHAAGGGVFEIAGNWVQIANNRLSKGQVQGWNGFGGSQMIFENNHLVGPMCTSYYNRREGSQNIYWGRNVHDQTYDGNNRETITSDLRDLTYKDTVEAWEDTAIVLKETKWENRRGFTSWLGGYVQLMDGKGAGQFRRIVKIDGNRVEIDRPWDIKPDKDTFLIIAGFRNRFLYIGNKSSDSTVSMQFYGSMIEPIVAESSFERTGGVHGFGMVYEPNWFFQYLDNTILEGNSQRGPYNDMPPRDAHLGFCDLGVPGDRKYPQCRACVMRGNHLMSNARLTSRGMTDGVLMEDNLIENADVGIDLLAQGRNLQVRNNRFENVDLPYNIVSGNVHVDPVERLIGNLEGTAAYLKSSGQTAPDAWKTILEKLKRGNAEAAFGKKQFAIKIAEKALLEAVQALSQNVADKDVDPAALKKLFGFELTTPNWKPVTPLVQRSVDGKADLLLRIPETAMLPMNTTITFDPELKSKFEDAWEFSTPMEIIFQPGRHGDKNFTVMKKRKDAIELLSLPISVRLNGDGWSFRFKIFLSDPHAVFTVKQLIAAGPIENPQKKDRSTLITLPKFKIEPDGKYRAISGEQTWKNAPLQQGGLLLRDLFQCEKRDQLFYSISALNASRPVSVHISPGSNSMIFVNGKAVGTTLERSQFEQGRHAVIRLNEGVNTIVMVSWDDGKKDDYRLSPPRITQVDPLFPDDLKELPVAELFKTTFPTIP